MDLSSGWQNNGKPPFDFDGGKAETAREKVFKLLSDEIDTGEARGEMSRKQLKRKRRKVGERGKEGKRKRRKRENEKERHRNIKGSI